MAILFFVVLESVLYFWFLFAAIDMFEVNDIVEERLQENRSHDVSLLCDFIHCQQSSKRRSIKFFFMLSVLCIEIKDFFVRTEIFKEFHETCNYI